MKRRQVLASLGAGISALAGCSGVLGGEPTPTLTPVDLPPPTTSSPVTNAAVTTECADSGGDARYVSLPFESVPEPPSQFHSLPCPEFGSEWSTVCYHTADIDAEEVLLIGGRTVDVTQYQGSIVDFVLANKRDESLSVQPGSWTILQETETEWEPIVSGQPRCTQAIPSGEVYWWRLGLDRMLLNPWTNVRTAELSLETGVYMVAVPVQLGDESDIVCVAPFEVNLVEGEERPTGTPTRPNS